MKKLFLLSLFVCISIIQGCAPSDEEVVKQLRAQRKSLSSDIYNLKIQEANLNQTISLKTSEIKNLDEKLKELKILESGKQPVYILKLHLKQSHFSLSIKKHIKDAMNAIDFEMPVSKEFYNSVYEGSEIVDNFRAGSFILYGSFGNWKMTVKSKEIR